MNCEQVTSLLVSYLHHETSPSERTLIRTHLAGCMACQKELALLSTVQSQLGSALQRRAAQVAPASDAWKRLEARLAQDAQPAPAQPETWFSRLKHGVSRVTSKLSSGDSKMNKRYTLATASVAMLAVMTLVAVLMFNSATSVSAQQIIDRASAAQSAAQATTGIEHYRIEIYRNMLALEGAQAGTTTTTDDYAYMTKDLYRSATYDAGKILTASAMDGAFSYWLPEAATGVSSQVVHRTPISTSPDARKKAQAQSDDANTQATSLFDHYRNNPRVELKGKETRADGTQVYVLIDRNYQTSNSGKGQPVYTGSMSMVFDAQTYRLLESETTVKKNGKEIVIENVRFLVQETLPVETPVTWDLSDLKDVTFVDDAPVDEQTEALPVPISIDELADHPQTYALKTAPAGFTVSIVAAPNQPADQPYAYEINYDNPAKENFGLQAVGIMDPGFIETSFYDGSYKTASGMVLNYSSSRPDGSPKGMSAMLTTPDGVSFLVFSTMSRAQVQKLIEELVPLH